MGRASCTDAHLPALKNTSKSVHWAHQRGLEAEERVLRYYQNKNYKLIRQRVKTPYAEIDLLLQSAQGHLLLVEVKASNSAAFLNYRISRRQKERLIRAVQFLAARFDRLVEIHWAFVSIEGEIIVIEDISG